MPGPQRGDGIVRGSEIVFASQATTMDAARAEARNLSDKIAEQNKAVRAMEEEADRREADAKARVAAAQAVARSAELSAQRLLSLALPQGADECAAARALIAREVRK